MFAADMLAWDLLFGCALIFAGAVFEVRSIRWGFFICGALCLVGSLFPITGEPRLQLPAIVGYAFGFPIVCLLLARLLFTSRMIKN